MAIPTALASTAELAMPRVRKFVGGLLALFGPSAELRNFFLCEPGVHVVYQGKEHWIEANWVADILAYRFNMQDLMVEGNVSKQIHIGDASVTPHSDKIEIRLWLIARVMRE